MSLTTKPLTIYIEGGLGNQLFMIFTGISKAKDENREYLLYINEKNDRHYYFNDLLKILYANVINYNNIQLTIQSVYNEPKFCYNEIPNNVDMIKGYFQSHKYFNKNALSIINDLKINEIANDYKINFKSIALHFRLGDYVGKEPFYRILPFVYYVKAIEYLRSNLIDFDDYTFLIFGEKADDNMINDFITQINFNVSKPIEYIKIYKRYPDIKDYEEFLYMSSCNHIIIANSTFSWFSAYLSNFMDNNDNRIIICPSKCKWFGDKVYENEFNNNMNDLYLDDWIQLDF